MLAQFVEHAQPSLAIAERDIAFTQDLDAQRGLWDDLFNTCPCTERLARA